MAEHDTTTTSGDCWPTKRDMLGLGYTWGYLQATVDIHKAQQSAPKSGGWMSQIADHLREWVKHYELASKLWAWQRRLALPVLIVSWWEQLLWLVRLLLG